MKKAIASVIALIALNTFGVASPAQAGYFNDLYHAADDSGYTAPIRIECSDGRIRYLYVGEGSMGKCGAHVKRVWPSYNQMVTCYNTLPPYQRITYWDGNTRELPSAASFRCYMQRPI